MKAAARWTEEELQILEENYASYGPTKMVELLPERNKTQISMKASSMGLTVAGTASRFKTSDLIIERRNIVEEVMFLIHLVCFGDPNKKLRAMRCVYDAVKYQKLSWWYQRRNLKLGEWLEIFVTGYVHKEHQNRLHKRTRELKEALVTGAFEGISENMIVHLETFR